MREPEGQRAEDEDTARLVDRFHGGETEAFGTLYTRYFRRVFNYLRVVLNDTDEAEDGAQESFTKALEALPRYKSGDKPFRAWLFTIVRNLAIERLQELQRVEPMDPTELDRMREDEQAAEPAEPQLDPLTWIADYELTMFVERMPLPQRQVLLLRYMLDLPHAQIAKILGRTHSDVRLLHHRAVRFLEKRLRAIGRTPRGDRNDRSEWRTRVRKAPVLRNRRWALDP